MMTWQNIESKLKDSIEDVCRHLFPNGKRDGSEYVVGSLSGEPGQSLKINLSGKLGVWKDFAGDSGGNSLLSLWMHARNLPKFDRAVVEAKQFLGLATDFPEKRVRAFGAASQPSERPDDSRWKAIGEMWSRYQPLVEGGPVWDYLVKKRRLDSEVLAAFDVREYFVHGKWNMVFPYFIPATEDSVIINSNSSVPAWLKFEALEREEGKKKEWTSKAPEKSLFGMQLDGHAAFRRCRHVLICEGEKDALTWASYGCAAWGVLPVSVPFGAKWKGQDKCRPSPNREWLDRTCDWLENFETVFVQMDGDEAGQRAAADIITEIGPRRCRLVTLPEKFKDANDCLLNGVPPETLRAALDNARDFAPDKVVSAVTLEADFLKWVFDRDVDGGVALPFDFPLRFRAGETTLWLGIEKSGKTTLLNFATVAAIDQGERGLVCSFEVPWQDTNDKLCRQAFGGLYFNKRGLMKCEADDQRAAFLKKSRVHTLEAHRWLSGNLWYYVHVGIGDWRQLMEDIRWARRRLGITWVQIDNFMRLGIPKDDYAQQADAIISLVSLAMELGLHLHIVLHQNKSEGYKGVAGGKRSASGAHELLGNPHNIVEVTRDDKKGKQVSELFEQKKTGMVSPETFAKEMGELDLKPDGKLLLHAQRNGDVQDGSKYLWFLWEAQQYVSVPPGHADHHSTRYSLEQQRDGQDDLPTDEEPGFTGKKDMPN